MVCSQVLFNSYTQRVRLAELPAAARPVTPQEGYRCQAQFVEKLGRTLGYKIACTNAIAQRFLSMPEPFYGRLLAASTFDSPARLAAGDFFMRVIETGDSRSGPHGVRARLL